MTTNIERRDPALATTDIGSRELVRLMAESKLIASVPGLIKELAGNPDAVAAVRLSLRADGFPETIPNINSWLTWIEGKPTRSAFAYQALAYRAGYELIPVVDDSDELAEILVNPPAGEQPKRIRYTIGQAETAELLDEWVEEWKSNNNGKRYCARKLAIRRNGRAINEPWPEWAVKEIEDGKVKRNPAWFRFRADMLYKSCAIRAVRKSCPHVLAGVPAIDRPPRPAVDVDSIPVDESPTPEEIITIRDDDGVEYAEIVVDDPATPTSQASPAAAADPAPAPRPAGPGSTAEPGPALPDTPFARVIAQMAERAGMTASSLANLADAALEGKTVADACQDPELANRLFAAIRGYTEDSDPAGPPPDTVTVAASYGPDEEPF